MRECWQCGATGEGLFCEACKALQAPVRDYFTFFGFERQLTVDADELQRRFYALSRQLHPDRYQRKPAREREQSLEATAILNDGYRVLRDPVQRAEYVLSANGFEIAEQRSKDVPPELLEEVFELNMALEEMRSGDDSARPQLEEARRNFGAMLAEADGALQALFHKWDGDGKRETLAEIRGVLNRRKYVANLVREVDKELGPRMDTDARG